MSSAETACHPAVPRNLSRGVTAAWRGVARLPARALLLLVGLYQRTLSPLVPVLTLGTCGCRFSPTCSHYAAEAIRTHGAGRGVVLALIRLVKCTPLHPGGLDPVPPRRPRPRVHRVSGNPARGPLAGSRVA